MPESNNPVSLATVWDTPPRLVQVTSVPGVTVVVAGSNPKSRIPTPAPAAVATGVCTWNAIARASVTKQDSSRAVTAFMRTSRNGVGTPLTTSPGYGPIYLQGLEPRSG